MLLPYLGFLYVVTLPGYYLYVLPCLNYLYVVAWITSISLPWLDYLYVVIMLVLPLCCYPARLPLCYNPAWITSMV